MGTAMAMESIGQATFPTNPGPLGLCSSRGYQDPPCRKCSGNNFKYYPAAFVHSTHSSDGVFPQLAS